MEVNLTSNAAQATAQGAIDLDHIGPAFWIILADITPALVVVIGAAKASGFRRQGIIMAAEPGEAVLTAHALFDQGPPIDLQSSNEGFIRAASSFEIPIHCSATG